MLSVMRSLLGERGPVERPERLSIADVGAAPSAPRSLSLDKARGLAVVLLLADHAAVTAQGLGAHWLLWARIGLTRPSLPLFMVVSGALLAPKPGRAYARQVGRVLPWAVIATGAAGLIPGFGTPDPLGVYCLAVVLLYLLRRWPVAGMAACFLATIDLPVRLWSGYQPWELAAWLLLGASLVRYGVAWDRAYDRAPSWLAILGRHSLVIYVGQLVLLAAIAQVWVMAHV